MTGAALPWMAGAFAFGYVLGSIPFGLLLTRPGRKGLALAPLVLAGATGAAALLIVYRWYGEPMAIAAGAGAMLGHVFPVWLGFKGGKGVATALGTLLAAAWPIGALACLAWLVVAALFRFSSLAALVAIALAPMIALVLNLSHAPMWGSAVGYGNVAILGAFIAVLVYIRHEGNIRRLLSGTEPKIGAKRDQPKA